MDLRLVPFGGNLWQGVWGWRLQRPDHSHQLRCAASQVSASVPQQAGRLPGAVHPRIHSYHWETEVGIALKAQGSPPGYPYSPWDLHRAAETGRHAPRLDFSESSAAACKIGSSTSIVGTLPDPSTRTPRLLRRRLLRWHLALAVWKSNAAVPCGVRSSWLPPCPCVGLLLGR